MENASKALLISAAILMSLMILSLLVIGYDQISNYYKSRNEATETLQLEEFNKKFQNYDQKEIRGSELISIMNMVIDYNEREVYADGTNYSRIKVTIKIGDDLLNQFKYNQNLSKNSNLSGIITNTLGETSVDDKKLIAITETETKLINNNQSLKLTADKLQKLSANISNIIIDADNRISYPNTDTVTWQKQSDVSSRLHRQRVLKNILGITLNLNEDTAISDTQSQNTINTIKEITNEYYQYTQFKRAHFKLTKNGGSGLGFDTKTGRVNEMTFEVVTSNGNVKFN